MDGHSMEVEIMHIIHLHPLHVGAKVSDPHNAVYVLQITFAPTASADFHCFNAGKRKVKKNVVNMPFAPSIH
jgi:hypothetical protein